MTQLLRTMMMAALLLCCGAVSYADDSAREDAVGTAQAASESEGAQAAPAADAADEAVGGCMPGGGCCGGGGACPAAMMPDAEVPAAKPGGCPCQNRNKPAKDR